MTPCSVDLPDPTGGRVSRRWRAHGQVDTHTRVTTPEGGSRPRGRSGGTS